MNVKDMLQEIFIGKIEERITERLAKHYEQEPKDDLATQLAKAVDYEWDNNEDDYNEDDDEENNEHDRKED